MWFCKLPTANCKNNYFIISEWQSKKILANVTVTLKVTCFILYMTFSNNNVNYGRNDEDKKDVISFLCILRERI